MPAAMFVKDGVQWIKAGEKGKHIPIPGGWELVTEGVSKVGDQYLYCGDLFQTVSWNKVKTNDEAEDGDGDVGYDVAMFEALIREKKT